MMKFYILLLFLLYAVLYLGITFWLSDSLIANVISYCVLLKEITIMRIFFLMLENRVILGNGSFFLDRNFFRSFTSVSYTKNGMFLRFAFLDSATTKGRKYLVMQENVI